MRFRPWSKPEPYRDTSRKRAAFKRKQRLEREALPLFSDMIAAGQHGVDEEMGPPPRLVGRARTRAARPARRPVARSPCPAVGPARRSSPHGPKTLAGLPLSRRSHLSARSALSDRCRPGRPASAALDIRRETDGAHHAESRKIRRSLPPDWPSKNRRWPEDHARRRVPVLRQSGILFLRTRVRLNDPHESFYTSSSHRLRDSRAGHRIDLEVRGDCSDAELELIRRLAQEADTRPVVVRRVETLTPTTGKAAP